MEERVEELREKLSTLDPQERELTIVENLCQAIREKGPKYVLPFRFIQDGGTRTSHHLILISKHPKGYEIMKEIMAKESSDHQQGVATFEYNPASVQQPFLLEFLRPLDQLQDMLLEEFAGQTIRMRKIFEQHNVGTPFVAKNYKDVLLELESQGKITASKHRKNSFGDKVEVTFPQQGEQ